MVTDFNPKNLASFRNQRRISREEIAKYLGTSLERLDDFESGKRSPTSLQTERLSELFGVNVGELYGETNVRFDEDLIDYRTHSLLPAKLSVGGLKKIVRAERHAKFTKYLLHELKDNFVPAIPRIHGSLSSELASSLRERFDEWMHRASGKEKIFGSNEAQFLNWLRIYTELQGAITSIHDAPEDDYWGFYTDSGIDFPTIFINRKIQAKKSQLFTFCHEMAHYIEDAEGISNPYSTANSVEKRCNRFSAEFLAPSGRFAKMVEGLGRTVRDDQNALIKYASSNSLLSKQAAAMRLKELGYLNSNQLADWYNQNLHWYKKEKRREIDEAPNIANIHHAKSIGEIGYLPVYLSSLAVARGVIDSFDVESALGISRKTQEKAFALAKRRVEAAIDDAP